MKKLDFVDKIMIFIFICAIIIGVYGTYMGVKDRNWLPLVIGFPYAIVNTRRIILVLNGRI